MCLAPAGRRCSSAIRQSLRHNGQSGLEWRNRQPCRAIRRRRCSLRLPGVKAGLPSRATQPFEYGRATLERAASRRSIRGAHAPTRARGRSAHRLAIRLSAGCGGRKRLPCRPQAPPPPSRKTQPRRPFAQRAARHTREQARRAVHFRRDRRHERRSARPRSCAEYQGGAARRWRG